MPPARYGPARVAPVTAPRSVHAHDREFYWKLALSRGPSPVYHIVACPIPGIVGGDGDIDWRHQRAYSIRHIPDGYTIHAGLTPHTGPYREDADASWRVAFVPANRHLIGDWAYTRHHRIRYLRARIARGDVPALLGRHAFRVFTDFPLTPQAQRLAGPEGLAHFTVRMAETWAQHSRGGQPDGQTYVLTFPEGQRTAVDKHAWETW